MLLLLVGPNLYSLYKKQQTKNFFNIFDTDILYIQNEAFGSRENVRILFESDRYIVQNFHTGEELIRPFPNHLTYALGNNRISFNYNGTIINPGTHRFYENDKVYQVVFPLGKGRHYIEER